MRAVSEARGGIGALLGLQLLTTVAAVALLGRLAPADLEATTEAGRLALAGAWAMAALGFVSFLAGLGLWRRVQRRVLAPILEVDAVLAAARAGDERRRCSKPWEPEAGGRLVENLNWALDRRVGTPDKPSEDAALRAVVVGLLDRTADRPALVVRADGGVTAANEVALAGLPEGATAGAVAEAVARGEAPTGWSVAPLGPGLWLATGPATG